MEDNIVAVETTEIVAASEEVVQQGARDGAKATLNAIEAVRKSDAIPEEVKDAAVEPLVGHLHGLIAEIGTPVARGNTLFVAHAGEVLVVDLTPGVLVRL